MNFERYGFGNIFVQSMLSLVFLLQYYTKQINRHNYMLFSGTNGTSVLTALIQRLVLRP